MAAADEQLRRRRRDAQLVAALVEQHLAGLPVAHDEGRVAQRRERPHRGERLLDASGRRGGGVAGQRGQRRATEVAIVGCGTTGSVRVAIVSVGGGGGSGCTVSAPGAASATSRTAYPSRIATTDHTAAMP